MPNDHGLGVSRAVLGRQIAALPCPRYEIRLIHSRSRQPYPGGRRWTASQLLHPATLRFLRLRNRQGYDVYFRPYAGADNAGYILLDLDHPAPGIFACLHAQGHEPSVVVETSPGRFQTWIRVSSQPLPPTLATRISRRLAQFYAADLGSAEGRHLGRLAGFTNRKPQRRKPDGLAPWVKLIYAREGLAPGGAALIQLAAQLPARAWVGDRPLPPHALDGVAPPTLDSTTLRALYQTYLHRLRILERYPSPDWSIVDQWIARELLQVGYPLTAIAAVLRQGSPGFPRRHSDPEDYLRRTLRGAARRIRFSVFPVSTC